MRLCFPDSPDIPAVPDIPDIPAVLDNPDSPAISYSYKHRAKLFGLTKWQKGTVILLSVYADAAWIIAVLRRLTEG